MQHIAPHQAIRVNQNTEEMILLGLDDGEGHRPFIATSEDFDPNHVDWFWDDEQQKGALEEYPDTVEPTLEMIQAIRIDLDRELQDIMEEGLDELRCRFAVKPESFPFSDADTAHQKAEGLTRNLNAIRLLAGQLNEVEIQIKRDAA